MPNVPCRTLWTPSRGPQITDELAISGSQTYALVRSGDLPAIKIGGRGQWRVERTALEEYIVRIYTDTKQFVAEHPLGSGTAEYDEGVA